MTANNNHSTAAAVLLGGVASVAVLAPLERVKLLLQTQDGNRQVRSRRVLRYGGAVDCVRRVQREQGSAAFYRGSVVGALRWLPEQAVAAALADQRARLAAALLGPRWRRRSDTASLAVQLLGGALSQALASGVCLPLDVARTCLAADVCPGPASVVSVRELWHAVLVHGGVGALSTALALTAVRSLLSVWLQCTLAARLQRAAAGRVGAQLAGWMAALPALLLTYPLDTLQRRLFVEAALPAHARQYAGAVDCLRSIVHSEGATALYAGLGVELIRQLFASLLFFGCDWLVSHLQLS